MVIVTRLSIGSKNNILLISLKKLWRLLVVRGSDFGACRVKQHVIDHQPDLVFIEFAVNDNRMRMQFVRETIEGIVDKYGKQILLPIFVLFIHFLLRTSNCCKNEFFLLPYLRWKR